MQRSLTRLSSRFLPACRFVLHPTGRLVSRSTSLLALRREYLVGIGSGVCSVLSNSQRSYVRGGDGPPRVDNKNDAIALNRKIIGFGKEAKWKEILRLAEKEKDRFNNVNFATVFSQLGRIRNWDRRDPRFGSFVKEYAARLENRGLRWAGIREVANVVYSIGRTKLKTPETKPILVFVSRKENIRTLVREGTPQTVANVAWAFATLGIKSPELFAEIETRADWLVGNGKPQEVANTAWASAKTNARSPKLFAAIADRAEWLATNGKAQEVANTAWAFATQGIDAPGLFAAIEARADRLVANGKPQEVANVAWAFATTRGAGVFPEKLLEEIEARADWLLANGTPQAVANVAWAFATLRGVKPPRKLFAGIEARADWLVTNGTPQAVANTAWAFATLNTKAPKLFAAIEAHAEWMATTGTPQSVANTAWAFATLNTESPGFFAEIETRAEWLAANGSPQNVANTIWAASRFRYHSPRLMREADSCGARLVEDGTAQMISNSAIAFARVGCDAPAFFAAVANNVSKLINDGNPQHITNTCYAMAVLDLGEKHPESFRRLWNAAIGLDTETLPDEELRQLGQVLAFCTANGMELQQPPASLVRKIEAASPDFTRSRHHREVAKILGRLGLDDCEKEVSALENSDNNMLSIDFACRSRMVAIEYDGESHFLRELGTGRVTKRENGPTKAKRRFLRRMGWNVVNIDYQDWIDAYKKNCRSEFLRKKLDRAGIQIQ